MRNGRRLRAALLLFTALLLQASLISRLEVFGAHGEILLLVPITAGLASGADRGATAGFAAGMVVDLFVHTPFGLTALAYTLTGYVVGALQTGVLRASWWLPPVTALLGSAMGVVLFALAATVLGTEGILTSDLVAVVAVVSFVNALLVLPAARLARWVEGDGARHLALR